MPRWHTNSNSNCGHTDSRALANLPAISYISKLHSDLRTNLCCLHTNTNGDSYSNTYKYKNTYTDTIKITNANTFANTIFYTIYWHM